MKDAPLELAGLWSREDLGVGEKTCNSCRRTLPLTDFYYRSNRRQGRRTERTYSFRCKACDREAVRTAKAIRGARPKSAPGTKACRRCWAVKPANQFNRTKYRSDGLVSECRTCQRDKMYGLNPGEWDDMFAGQGGVCAVCSQPGTHDGGRGLVVDHCHSSGHVRGLLCNSCNAALGMLRDDPALFLRAIEYLKAASMPA